MDNSRRDFIKLSAAAVGGLSAPRRVEAATAIRPIPNTAADKLRLVTFAPDAKGAPRIGLAKASGRVVDIGAAAKKHSTRLSFDPSRMVSLIAGSDRALKQVMELAAASDEGPALDSVRIVEIGVLRNVIQQAQA